jgi:hypothetical protein
MFANSALISVCVVRPQNVNPEPHVFEAVVCDTSDATQQCRMFEAFAATVRAGDFSGAQAQYWPLVTSTTCIITSPPTQLHQLHCLCSSVWPRFNIVLNVVLAYYLIIVYADVCCNVVSDRTGNAGGAGRLPGVDAGRRQGEGGSQPPRPVHLEACSLLQPPAYKLVDSQKMHHDDTLYYCISSLPTTY